MEPGGDPGGRSSAVGGPATVWKYDVFISHASEDNDLAVPLARALKKKKLKVWIDEHQMEVGDDIEHVVGEGLAQSQYGVVILSEVSLGKFWVRHEVDVLRTREKQLGPGDKVFLPVWRGGVDEVLVGKHIPSLAGRHALKDSDGVKAIVTKVLRVVRPPQARKRWPWAVGAGLGLGLACLVLIAVLLANRQPANRIEPSQLWDHPIVKVPEQVRRPGPDTDDLHMALDGPPKWGPDTAPVTIEVWSDVGPACATVESTVRSLLDANPNRVRIIWKDLTVAFHQHAFEAAVALRAAYAQGRFWAMHNKLCGNRERLEPSDLEEYATELRLNMSRFRSDQASPEIQARIRADTQQAVDRRVREIPAFFINGQRLSSELSYEDISARIVAVANTATP